MSAAPSLPPNQQPPDRNRLYIEPPRRRRWPRILAWIGGIVLGLIVLIVIGVAVLLHSSKFHAYVLKTAEQKITAALGSNVAVQNYALNFNGISPTLDVYGVVVHGADPYPNPPILQIEHLRAAVRVVSLLHGTWYLNDLEVHHPVVQAFVDKRGATNIPTPKSSSNSKSNTTIWSLGVRHAVLDQGEVFFNNRKSLMSADLHQLTFQAGFDPSKTMYAGTLSYRDGHLELSGYNPLEHDLDASFKATPQTFTLEKATLRSGNSSFVLNAAVNDYSNPKVNATYSAKLDVGELRQVMKNPSLPKGVINTSGTLDYTSTPNTPALNVVKMHGTIGSGLLQVVANGHPAALRDLHANYTVANGNLAVSDLHANLLGGSMTGNMTMQNIAGNSKSHLHAALNGVQLSQLQAIAGKQAAGNASVQGAVNAEADATWGKTMNDLVARVNGNVHGSVAPSGAVPVSTGAQSRVPLNGEIHAVYSAATKQATLTNSYLRTGQTTLTLNGTLSQHSALQVHLQATNLHELENALALFRAPVAGATPAPLGLYGMLTFNGQVTGSTSAPNLTGELVGRDLRVRGSSWKLLRTGVDLSPSNAALRNGQLIPATRGNIVFNLQTALRKWKFSKTSPFQVRIGASQLDAADMARLGGVQTPMKGTLNISLNARGTELSPVGNGYVRLTNATVSSQPVQMVNVNFNGTGDEVHSTLKIQMPAGVANAVLTYLPKSKGYDFQAKADNFQIGQLEAVKARNLQVAGAINLDASGRGTLADPQLTATLQIPQLQVKDQTLTRLLLKTDVANHLARIALDSDVVHSHVSGGGTVALTGDYMADLKLDTQQIPFAPLVAMYAPSQAGNLNGATELHATVRGPLKNKSLLEAHITVPTLNVNYKNAVQVGAAEPIHVDYVNGVLNVQKSQLRGTDTDLTFQGRIPVVDRAAPVSLLLLGTVDLKLAQLVNPDITSAGQLQFNINSFGQRSNPNVQGQVHIVNASFTTPDAPLGVSDGNGTLELTKDRLNITNLTAIVGGGQVTAKGGVLYRPQLQFDLAVAGQGIRLLYPDNVRTGLDLRLALTGTTEQSLLSGTVNVDQLSFTPDFDLMQMMGSLSTDTVPPPSQGFTDNMQLEINVRSTNGINLVNRQLSLQGSANLNVRGNAAQPVVLGRVNLTGGDLIFQGNRYKLQGGTVEFINPTRTEPSLNVAVTTTINQYNIAMRFEGPVDHMRTSYTSDPALPPSDIISLIAFGKTDEASAANPNPSGTLGAESMIASGVTSQLTNRVEKIAGISHLSIDPTLGGNQQSPGATVTIQQRVTSKIFVTFSTDVTNTQSQAIQLEYQKSRRLSFSGTRNQNGGFAFDTKIRKSW